MFYYTIIRIWILIHSIYGHSFVKELDRHKRSDLIIRPRYHDTYVQCRHHICDHVDVYPEMEILATLRDKETYKRFFGVVLNSSFTLQSLDDRDDTFLGRGKQLCLTEGTTTRKPKVMRNIRLEWKFVVNVEGYEQIFTSETCRYSRTKSSRRDDYCSDFGFSCKQSHQEVFLLTFEDGILDFDKFMVPTTCNCDCH